jgi:hypothetical protein
VNSSFFLLCTREGVVFVAEENTEEKRRCQKKMDAQKQDLLEKAGDM